MSVPTPVTYQEWFRNLLMVIDEDWQSCIEMDKFSSIDEVLTAMDKEMVILHPIHLRRMNLLKSTFKKTEKH